MVDIIVDQFVSTSNATKTFNKLTWRLSADHDFSPAVLGYASYNRGFKSGGFNTGTFDPVQAFKPEQIDAYEAGLKTELADRRVRLNLAGFFYDYKNIQTTSYPNGALLVANGGKARIYGIDLDGQVLVARGFTLSGGLEALHAKFKRFDDAPISSPAPGGGTVLVDGSAAGNYLPRAPKLSFNVAADYSREISIGKLSADLSYSYDDGFFGDPDNRLRQDAYGLINASLGLQTLRGGLGVKLWGKNLTNKDYAVTLAAQSQGDYVQYGAPRTYGFTVSKTF